MWKLDHTGLYKDFGFLKLGGVPLGVSIIRIIMFQTLYIGVGLFGKLPHMVGFYLVRNWTPNILIYIHITSIFPRNPACIHQKPS